MVGMERRRTATGHLTLGRIHTQRGSYWGSLDGRWRFATCRDALRSRLAAATNLVGTCEPALAARIPAWTDTALDELAGLGPPVLVHGDFGVGNLLLNSGIRVLDWEHARWGDVHEDRVKNRLAAKLSEPNNCGDASAVALLERGWSEVVGQPPPRCLQLERLLEVYLCCCLGVFFGGGADNAWLGRARELVGAPHRDVRGARLAGPPRQVMTAVCEGRCKAMRASSVKKATTGSVCPA